MTREQKEFLPDNVASLAYAGIVRELGFHVFTFGICKSEKPIGFVMIGYDIPYEPDDDLNEKYWFTRSSYFLWRFMIDKRYQGRGYGREAMKLIPDFIKTGPCGKAEYAWISYSPKNTVARRLYASFGFEEVTEAYNAVDDEMLAVLKL